MSKDYTLELARISTSPENYEGENWDDAMGLVVGLEAENNEHFKNIQALNSDRLQLEAENKAMRKALEEMLFAYENKDGEFPHQFEIDALAIANEALAGQDKENK